MTADHSLLLAVADGAELRLRLELANRHGLIAGATGTGKTVTLQTLAEGFSARGVPVFLADVKGDLAGLSLPGGNQPKVEARRRELKLPAPAFAGCPVTFWDVFGQAGHPIRATVSEMGPLLLARLLQLNDTQTGVLNLVFKIADEHGLLLLDFKDLRAMVQYVGENASAFTTQYGNISPASIGAIQRNLLTLETQGAEKFFAEPAVNLDDFLQTDERGRGVINLLAADRLLQSPRIYATLLLWLLSEVYERLPEVGDLPQPKLVFFFDEAHLLFADIPPVLLERIQQVVRLVRSKGVGVYFVTQNPRDIPDAVLGQLGNRVQHALRAYTPADQKDLRAAADGFRSNPGFDTARALAELAVGEALVSLLEANGQPAIVQRAFVVPPVSQLGPITPAQRAEAMAHSLVAGVYDQVVDRESAYERLTVGHAEAPAGTTATPAKRGFFESLFGGGGAVATALDALPKAAPRGRGGRAPDTLVDAMAKSAARTIGSSISREIVRGVLGSIFGGRRR